MDFYKPKSIGSSREVWVDSRRLLHQNPLRNVTATEVVEAFFQCFKFTVAILVVIKKSLIDRLCTSAIPICHERLHMQSRGNRICGR